MLPSGVLVVLQTFIGDHQDWITKANESQRMNGIDRLFKDCIVEIGGVKPTDETLKRILSNDRAFCLFQIRQESNKLNKNFTFKYEFPVLDGKKREEKYVVEFNTEDFEQRPYSWVFEAMKAEYIEEKEIPFSEKITDKMEKEILQKDFIKCYESYDEMLQAQSEQKIVLPDTKVEVTWTLLDVQKERAFTLAKGKKDGSTHDQLLIRNPVYEEDDYQEGDKKILVPIGKMTMDDIETLRGHIIETEGKINTSVVVSYQNTPGTEVQLNLLAVPAFFFPSLAN